MIDSVWLQLDCSAWNRAILSKTTTVLHAPLHEYSEQGNFFTSFEHSPSDFSELTAAETLNMAIRNWDL